MAIPPNTNGTHNVPSTSNGNHSDNGQDPPDAHHDEFSDDASWDVQEVQDGEFQAYFREDEGRLFHSHGGLPYPLPVDTPEQEVGICAKSCGH